MSRAIVVGGGAAGLLAAGTAARQGRQVIVLERNSRPARKILVTGKGRCNVTNNCDRDAFLEHIPRNARFLYSAYHALSPQDLMGLIEKQGVPLKTERGQRVFPCSDRAMDIADALQRYAKHPNVTLKQGRAVELMREEDRVLGVKLESGETVQGESVLIATGGLSYPTTGSTGDGYELARQAGHTVVPCIPSLIPLVLENGFVSKLQGLSLKNIRVQALDRTNGKTVYEDFGELLFTHYGVSGPVILSMSAHLQEMEAGRYEIHLDLKPALSEEQLDRRLLRDFEQSPNRDWVHVLCGLVPRSLAPVLCRLCGVPGDRKVHQITKEERHRFVTLCKDIPMQVRGFRPIEEAVVTRGGVEIKEIDPHTMESKRVPGLFFAGEVIDVDGYTGGFNLQIAFSTGYLAGMHI